MDTGKGTSSSCILPSHTAEDCSKLWPVDDMQSSHFHELLHEKNNNCAAESISVLHEAAMRQKGNAYLFGSLFEQPVLHTAELPPALLVSLVALLIYLTSGTLNERL